MKGHNLHRSPTVAAMIAAGVPPTLDKWLERNDAVGVCDAELLEVIPTEFGLRDEYEDRLRLNAEYEAKFADSRQQSHIVELMHGEA